MGHLVQQKAAHFRPYRAATAASTLCMTALPQARAITVVGHDQPTMVVVVTVEDRDDRGVGFSAESVRPTALLSRIQEVLAEL
jgi:hypothetical protein